MRKRLHPVLSLLLAAALLVGLMPAAFAAQPEESEGRTLRIRTVDELVTLAENCALDTWSDNVTVLLENDLSLSGSDFGCFPMFNGVFDGQGHTIYDLNLTDPQSPCGFFLETGAQAEIRRLHLSGAVSPRGEDSAVGGLAGVNRGRITACSFSGAVAGKREVGGLVGRNEATGVVTACTVSGSVSGLSATGGVAGYNSGALFGCVSRAYVNTESVDPALRLDSIDTSSVLNFLRSISSDNAGVSSDTGGVAGVSTGFVENCTNEGTVGYLHLGYNVGGVIGRSSGSVSACTNSGEVYGRRDVGGIVGQAEPYILSQQTEDLLNMMRYRASALSSALDVAIDDAEAYAAVVAGDLSEISASLAPVSDAISAVDPSDLNSVTAMRETISDSLGSMSGQMDALGQNLGAGAVGVSADLREVNENLDALNNLTLQAVGLFTGAEDASILNDDSVQEDVDTVVLGRVGDCVNLGSVNGDNNVGGVVGIVSLEDELDPENQMDGARGQLVRRRYNLRAVVSACVNRAEVSARHECAASIIGRMDLGYAVGCEAYGSAAVEEGSYAGGVVGLCYGVVHNCYAKCRLSANKYVGGIAGNGYAAALGEDDSSQISGCYSLVEIVDKPQFAGAISGGGEGVYERNYFVPSGFAGLNKLSVRGKAEPMAYGDFAAVDKLPEDFRSFTLRFVADGVTLLELPFSYGDSFDRSVFPQTERRDGAYAVWDRTDLTNLRFDTTVTAEYRLNETVLRSELTRADGRAAVYVDGQFQSGDALTLEQVPLAEDALDAFRGGWRRTVREQLSSLFHDHAPDWSVCVRVEETLRLSYPDDGLDRHTLRYLTPDGSTANHRLYLKTEDGYTRLHPETFGSYYLVTVPGTEAELTLVSTIQSWWIVAYVLLALLILALVIVLARRLVRLLRARKAKPRRTPRWVEAFRSFRAGHKKALRFGAAGAALLLVGLGLFLRFGNLSTAFEAYRLLRSFSTQETAIHSVIELHSELRDLTLENEIVRVKRGGKLIGCTEQYGVGLYFYGGQVYLENGRAFEVSSGELDQRAVMELAREIFRKGRITGSSEDGVVRYEAALDSEAANDVLRLKLSGESAALVHAENMTATLTASDGRLSGLYFSGSGETESGVAFTLSAALTPGPVAEQPTVPQAVLDAIDSGARGGTQLLSEDLLILLAAWMKNDSAESVSAEIRVSADCGPLNLDSDCEYLRTRWEDRDIHRLSSRLYTLYFTDSAACTASGASLGEAEQRLLDSSRLVSLAKELCLKGEFSCQSSGARRVYAITLSDADAAELAGELLPALKSLNMTFSDCALNVTVVDGELDGIALRCAGSVRVVSRDVDSALEITVRYTGEGAQMLLPAAVRAALLG